MANQNFRYNPIDDERQSIRPDLRSQEGINSNTAGTSSGGASNSTGGSSGGATDSTSESPSSLSRDESQPWRNSAFNSSIAGGVSNLNAASRLKNVFWGSKKRKRSTVGAGAGIATAASSLIIFSALSGPGMLVQVSHILQRSNNPMTHAIEKRFPNLFTYFPGATDLGETRLNILERPVLRDTLSKLSDAGVDIQTNGRYGLKTATLDSTKLSQTYPELDGMSVDEQKDFLAKTFSEQTGKSYTSDMFQRVGSGSDVSGNSYAINLRDFSISDGSSFINGSLSILDNGKILTGLQSRVLTSYYDLPSLFHPLQRAKAKVLQNATTEAERKSAIEDEDESSFLDPVKEKTAALRDSLQSKLSDSFQQKVTRVLITTALVCAVRSAADDAVQYDHDAIEAPAAAEGVNLMAEGEQIESGKDFTSSQVNAEEESTVDSNGGNLFQGKAFEALEGNANPQGQDIPTEYAQAFSDKTTADNIKNAIGLGNGILGDTICSKVSEAFQGLVAIALFVANAPDGESGSFAAYASTQAATNVAMGGAIYFFEHEFINIIKDNAIVPAVLSGPLGGNLAAFGTRAAANASAVASGGVALSNSNSQALALEMQQQSDKQFASENVFARVFDINDYRSLVGKLADSEDLSFTHDFANLPDSLAGFSHSLIGSIASIFTPKTSADSYSNYNWGFPQYGIPDSVLNDPSVADPYQNGDDVASLLNGPNGQSYISKADSCFGVKLDNSSGAWNVLPDHEVNPQGDDYVNNGCSNMLANDPNWKHIMMFVFDTRSMQGIACYEGDNQSCQDMGAGDSSASSTPTSPSPASGAGTTGISGSGTGKFTTDTSQAPYPGLSQMLARVQAASTTSGAATFCASIGGCSGKCESAVEMAWLGHRGEYLDPFGSAGNTPAAGSAWAAAVASGHAHPGDRNPPVGALLIYNYHVPSDPYGHITIYLGNNQVFSTDFDHPGSVGIDPASDIETGSWANSYVGWMDPYFDGKVGS